MNLLLHYFNLLPSFIVIFLIGLFFTISISTSTIYFFKEKNLNLITLALLPFYSTSLFISVSYFLIYFLPSPILSLQIIYFIFIALSIIGFYLKRKGLIKIIGNLLKNQKRILFSIALINLFIIIVFYNFIYLNGLHDEYFHQAAIRLFLLNNHYPFLNPYQIGASLNSSYHVGLYLPVVIIKSLFNLTIENALDTLKIALIIPIFPFLFLATKKILNTKSNFKPLILAFTILFAGPSLFFLDNFSQSVFLFKNYAEIYLPVLQDFAGISWLGLIFYLVFILFTMLLITKKVSLNLPSVILFFLVTTFSLLLINQAFFYIYLLNLTLIIILNLISFLKPFKKFKKYFLFLFLILILILPLFIFFDNFISIKTNSIKFIQNFVRVKRELGIPFENPISRQIEYASFSTNSIVPIFQKVGLLWFYALFLLISSKFRKWKTDFRVKSLMYLNLLFFPAIVYFINIGVSNLALNKFLRPTFVWIPLTVFCLGLNRKKSKLIFLSSAVLLFFSLLPSFVYFIRANNQNLQRFWVITNNNDSSLINYLNKNNNFKEIITNSSYSQYLVANNVNAQVNLCTNECTSPPKKGLLVQPLLTCECLWKSSGKLYIDDKYFPPLSELQNEKNNYKKVLSNNRYDVYIY